MRYLEINGWKLPIDECLQKALSKREKEFGCVATCLNLTYFMENKPQSNNLCQPEKGDSEYSD